MSAIDRLRESFRAFVRQEVLPRITYLGSGYAYTVGAWDAASQTADLSPLAQRLLPELASVPVRLPGLQVDLSGMTVLVSFENGDPARPVVTSLGLAASNAAALAIARQGDMVAIPVILVPAVAGPAATPVPNAYSIFLSPPPPPPFTPISGGPATLYGTVSSGSVKAKVV